MVLHSVSEVEEIALPEVPDQSPPQLAKEGMVNLPNFSKMKKHEILKWYETSGLDIPEIKTMKVTPMREALSKAISSIKAEGQVYVPPPKADLTTQDITGIDPDDLLIATVREVEAISGYDEAHRVVADMVDKMESNYFKLGGILSSMRLKGWLGEYSRFNEMVEQEFNLHSRKANYFISIYDTLTYCEVRWDQIKDIGWSKVAIIASRNVMNPDNCEDWIELAKESSWLELNEKVKEYKREGCKEVDLTEGTTMQDTVAVNVNLHDDQKEMWDEAIQKAKELSGSQSEAEAISNICTEYLSTGREMLSPASKLNIEDRLIEVLQELKDTAQDEVDTGMYVLGIFCEIFTGFPDITVENGE